MAKLADFIHLRVHSSYSLSEGAIMPSKLIGLCHQERMPAVAVTDTGNLFGSLEFSKAALSDGIQPIIGVQVAVAGEKKQGGFEAAHKVAESLPSLVLLAKNEQGYNNLLKLISRSFLDGPDGVAPHITENWLFELGDGLIVLSGGADGPIGKALQDKQTKEARAVAEKYKARFGDCFYIELQRHGMQEEALTEPGFLELAYDLDIPLVATNNVFFATRDMYEAHDALLCIAEGRFVAEENRRRLNKNFYFRNAAEMKEIFRDIPEAIENTVVIAKRCAVCSPSRDPILPHFDCGEGRDESDELRIQSEEGLERRLQSYVYTDEMDETKRKEVRKEYFDRLAFELDVIINMQFPGYFLIVSDFIKWSKRNNVPVGPGRGSGAGSIVAWSLEITDLDPLRFGLLFERFLNPERVSMPDFDIDFCQEKRDRVIRYVQEKYGRDRVAQIITFGKLQARAVLRDVGRVLQLPYNQVDRISKMIPFNPLDPVTLSKALEMDKDLQAARDDDPDVKHLIDICLQLEGLNRHASTHAAGVVIADRPLQELIPVYRDPRSDMPVTQYSMKYAESAGLVKFDFLGLKTLTVIAKAIELISNKGIEVDISQIPMEDKKTFEMLSKGDSVGVFQLESAGMRDTLRKLKPDNIEDIIALISLYRPGPMDNIPSYIARKHGTEEPDYLHPMLETVLKETYGVIIYQEQVMQIAQIMGGYSLGGADLLRRAMGKKIVAEMDAQRELFVKGAVENKVDKKQASSIFDLVAKFAGYGFNKSHAAAYALISYQTAWLKANYPVEFLAASMNLDIHDTDKINIFRQEAVTQGIEVLPPDINRSFALFVPEKLEGSEALGIRYALGALKNVGTAAMEELVNEREQNGAFKDVFDVMRRASSKAINKRQLENLIKAGAFDCVHENRHQLHENVDTLTRYATVAIADRNSDQGSLFGGADAVAEEPLPKMKEIKDWIGQERLMHAFNAIGLYLGEHPMGHFEQALERMNILSFGKMNETLADGNSFVKIAGVLTSKRMRSSQRGRFATLILSDPSGMVEVSLFDEDLLSAAREVLEVGNILMMSAEVRKDEGGMRLTAQSVSLLEDELAKRKRSIHIHLEHSNTIAELAMHIPLSERGRASICLSLVVDEKEVDIKLPGLYDVKMNAVEEIRALDCVKDVIEN